MTRKSESQIDTEMAKRIRWENSQNERKEFMRVMAEKLKQDMKDPETVGNFGKKPKKKDPFEGMGFVGVFGLPIARYAYDYMDEEPEKKPKKKENVKK